MISNALTCVVQMRLRTTARLLAKKYRLNPTGRRGLATTVHLGNKHIQSRDVWVEASPRVCLHDVHTELKAGGLKPNSPVTLRADLIDEHGKHFCSHAHYISDSSGRVDVTLQESVGGSYTGIFPAGLLTTLKPAADEFSFLRLCKRNPETPWKIDISLIDGHKTLHEESNALSTVCLERHFISPDVQRIPIRQGRVRGTLFLPGGKGPYPGVLDMFGAVGGLLEFRSALLASRGIASLALAYFGFEDLPKSTEHFELDYFEEAINVLLSQENVVKDRCGIVAVSKSTDISFALATWVSQVKAVVCISGTPIPLDSTLSYRGKTLVEGLKMGFEHLMIDEEGRIYPKRNLYLEHFTPFHPQFIPIEKADDGTHFLAVAGDDDGWSTDIPTLGVQQRLDAFGKTNYEVVIYPGAGHLIEPPYGPLIYQSYHRYLPVTDEEGMEKMIGQRILWGGHAEGTCKAQEDLWLRMRKFITRHVQDESPWYQKHLQQNSKL
ncbi:acyl-coenzyme A thioesterase 5-like isoform X2 [Macrobrachium nipponense]|uniref:acyl-coenzyme A thioesterase 5-like isoform X2 n=1 Tax=Macrobrachium nipponense TaxID=159736 RepID=UPI0030C8A157